MPHVPGVSYTIQRDPNFDNAYFIDLGSNPDKVKIIINDLQTNLIESDAQFQDMNIFGSQYIGDSNLNVPGIMLSHNQARMKLPKRVRKSMGKKLKGPNGKKTKFAEVDYIAVQMHGDGSVKFREFADLDISFPCGDLNHSDFGLKTVRTLYDRGSKINSCEYVDSNPSMNTTRFFDRFVKKGKGQVLACGDTEPEKNQSIREGFNIANNSVQLLTTVSANSETYYIFYGDFEGSK